MNGYGEYIQFDKDRVMQNHVSMVWSAFCVLIFLFIMFAGILLAYHTFLILSA
jgi:hypothetical protein